MRKRFALDLRRSCSLGKEHDKVQIHEKTLREGFA